MMNQNQTVNYSGKTWTIRFTVPPISDQTEILSVRGKNSGIQAYLENQWLKIQLKFTARNESMTLSGKAAAGDHIILQNLDYKTELYINGVLTDEEWQLGTIELDSAVCENNPAEAAVTPELYTAQDRYRSFINAQNYKMPGHNTHAGDCMPFYDGNTSTFHLFYLYDRRGHGSKWGLGAHQWAHISSRDLIHWTEHPLALAIDRQSEGSICTGSVLYHAGLFYAFCAIRACDGSPARLTWATSSDGIHFTKTERYFELKAPYHTPSARDPKVFLGNDGIFHMILTTSLVNENGEAANGCLAHITSADLLHWEQREPFLTLDITDQPECSDYFYKNGYYYLIYSNFGRAKYFISKNPFTGWHSPENNSIVNNTIVSDVYRVPKCAFFGDRIIFAGFYVDEGVWWGGTVHFYEAIQQPDGTLLFADVPEMAAADE